MENKIEKEKNKDQKQQQEAENSNHGTDNRCPAFLIS